MLNFCDFIQVYSGSSSISLIIRGEHAINCMPYSPRITSEVTLKICYIATMEFQTVVLSTFAG